MTVAGKVAAAVAAVAARHRRKLGYSLRPDLQAAGQFLEAFAVWVRALPENDDRLVALEAIHLERTGDYFTGDGAQTALSRVKLGWDTDDYDELLGALVELEEEDFALG